MNPRVLSLNKSATLKITALTKQLIKEGKEVVNFAAGEPDFDTPDFIKKEAVSAINKGFTKYTPSAGIHELKEAISDKLRKDNKINCSKDNIIVTSGAKYAVFAALFALVDYGDEVIVPSPYWVSYPEMIKLASGKIVILPTASSENFKINPQALKKIITPKTKVLILNYPNNPTGITYSRRELNDILEVVKDKGIFVISDEIYEALIYDDREHVSFASLAGAGDSTVTINGFSKTYSMTGWRVGYLAAPDNVIGAVSKIIDHTTSCASSISQKAALVALSNKQWQNELQKEFQKRRDLLWEGLCGCEGRLAPVKSEGTFYMFCNVQNTGLSSYDFSSRLLQDCLVSCIPADSFGSEGFVRFSFATSSEQILKGVGRIKDFIGKI